MSQPYGAPTSRATALVDGEYQLMDEEFEAPNSGRGGSRGALAGAGTNVTMSEDEALARALAEEIAREDQPPGTERDEELALALSLAMEEEDLASESRRVQFRDDHPPSKPPKPSTISQENSSKADSEKPSFAFAQSMLDRLAAPFRGLISEDPEEKAQKKALERRRRRELEEKRFRKASVVYNIMEVYVPDFLRTENFLVLKPDGTATRIHVPLAWQRPAFYLPYDGEPLVTAPPRILDEAEQHEAVVDYYRFNPYEVEAEVDIIPGPRPLGGLELVSQPEGVFIKWGIFPLPPSRRDSYDGDLDENDYGDSDDDYFDNDLEVVDRSHIVCAGDLIVQVGDMSTTSLESLKAQIVGLRVGTKLKVRVLRKPPPEVKCPTGHLLIQDDERVTKPMECDSCRMAFGRFHCFQCGFSLCPSCYKVIYSHSKARFPKPVNNDHEFTEAPRDVRLSFTNADVGVRVLIYWYTTAEWWIGRIESYDPIKGHVVVYEERNGNLGRETISDFRVREYRILQECILQEDEEKLQTMQAIAESVNDVPRNEQDLLDLSGEVSAYQMDSATPVGDQAEPFFSGKASVATANLLDVDFAKTGTSEASASLLEGASAVTNMSPVTPLIDQEETKSVMPGEDDDKILVDPDDSAYIQSLLAQSSGDDSNDPDGPP